jgi:hypothetical protein
MACFLIAFRKEYNVINKETAAGALLPEQFQYFLDDEAKISWSCGQAKHQHIPSEVPLPDAHVRKLPELLF